MEMSTVESAPVVGAELTAATLIGQVATLYLRNRIKGNEAETGTARFILDQLKGEQMAAIARAILDDGFLVNQVQIQLPISQLAPYAEAYGLPEDILTSLRATYLRNADCSRAALLLANTGDDEAQSLNLIEPIGSAVLLANPDLWVEAASLGLNLSLDQLAIWERVLRALMDLSIRSLPHVAEYVLRTRREIINGSFLLYALGAALPALAMPRDTTLFVNVPERFYGQQSRWKGLFQDAYRKRAPYLRKQTPAQTLLTAANLRASFLKVKEGIIPTNHPAIEAFIATDGQWNAAAKQLAECEWEEIKPLFDGLRRERLNLGTLTRNFFNDRDPDLLSSDDREYLKSLIQRNPSSANDDDRTFYEQQRHHIIEDRPLKAAWDKFAFGRPQECEDFLAGIALCLERLTVEDYSTNRRLKIRCDAKTPLLLRKLNSDAWQYFAARYHGLKQLFGAQVEWEVGELFNYAKLIKEWDGKYARNRSEAKAALQLKFTIELQMDSLVDGQASGSTNSLTQLIWTFTPNKATREFATDWDRLVALTAAKPVAIPMVLCRVGREAISAKGRFQSVNLSDVRTLTPAFGQNRGSFVGPNKAGNNLAKLWEAHLKLARAEDLVTADAERELTALWEQFKQRYTAAIVGFKEEGVACEALLQQGEAYARLLIAICKKAVGDRNRGLLLLPLLRIGSVTIDGDSSSEIIAPWHPLRMIAMAVKARRIRELIKSYVNEPEVRFGDAGRMFFKDLRDELEHAFYPEVVLGRYDSKPQLLSLTDTCGDYTLHESPVANGIETSDNPTESSKRVAELVARYLALQPHESANLSVVLYNCDSARLPQAVVDRIGAMHEDEEDVRCQIVLRHHDPSKLHPLYERIVEASDSDPDAYSTSEATRDFMARLRIGISAEQAPAPNEKDGPPNDIVFLQDVIARHATVEWYKENAQVVPLMDLVPAQWSRRRPSPAGDMKSVVYLCSPAQSVEGWAYLTAITSFVKGNWDGDTAQRLLPARQLDFQDPNMQDIFVQTHNLGNWVVNYDELLDRRQLIDRKVRVIRYKQSSTQGRNLIVSSTASLGLLHSMVQRRIGSLQLGLEVPALKQLADRFIQEANTISGDIVLRAARRGRSASELMGVVLSAYLIQHEMQTFNGGQKGQYGWYFLDDYAEWLGQREEQMADILMLSPSVGPMGELRLSIVVSEAKFIDRSSLHVSASKSRNQLRDTLKRIHDALFGTPERLDRALWLARLSDLILDGVQFTAGTNINLADWRMAIRKGECYISLRGYSHVFVSGMEDDPLDADFIQIPEVNEAYQEVFSWNQVRSLVSTYAVKGNPQPIRLEKGNTAVWESQTFTKAAGCIKPGEADQLVVASTDNNSTDNKTLSKKPTKAAAPLPPVVPSTPTPPTEPTPSLWAYPSIQKLMPATGGEQMVGAAETEWLNSVALRTKSALQGFNLNAPLQQQKLTPNAALLTFRGSANLTVDQVLRRQVEFKTTYGLSVVSVRPEAGSISLAIERPIRQVVRLEDIWGRWTPNSGNGNQTLPIAIREDNGELLFLSPQKNAPHTLIAGSTGSGKSVLVQNIILSIAATNTPEQAQIIIIDPKQGVDYFALEPLPHVKGGAIIVEQESALDELTQLVEEMEGRYRRFREMRVPNLTAYNARVAPAERLPVIWLVHDEFADWMQIDEYKQAVTAIVARLGVKARAAGIYLVFAAQRPDANVMPMQLRANLGNRLILRVDSEGTSEIALGLKGAERLLGKGHLLAKLEGEPDLIFGQVPFIQDEVIEALVGIMIPDAT
jgi:S-DNA-T family DNA segregation ATPase FtsK/SpoIIIE